MLKILKGILTRVEIMIKKIMINFNNEEMECNLNNLFSFECKKNQSFEAKQLPLVMFSDDLSLFLYNYLMNILIYGKQDFKKIVLTLDHDFEAKLSENLSKIDFKLPELYLPKSIKDLKETKRKIFNPLKFLNKLLISIKDILSSYERILLNISNDDLSEFLNDIKISICKEKCPSCQRLCGVNEDVHPVHKCIYGHQIRAIGGIMLENGEASISRCEDISDTDKIKFLGDEKSWLDFKKYWSNHPNTKWSFEDILKTRDDQKLKDRFRQAWHLIGEKFCSEYKQAKMKYVAYNQENVDQQIKAPNVVPNHYIFLIDSSSF